MMQASARQRSHFTETREVQNVRRTDSNTSFSHTSDHFASGACPLIVFQQSASSDCTDSEASHRLVMFAQKFAFERLDSVETVTPDMTNIGISHLTNIKVQHSGNSAVTIQNS